MLRGNGTRIFHGVLITGRQTFGLQQLTNTGKIHPSTGPDNRV